MVSKKRTAMRLALAGAAISVLALAAGGAWAASDPVRAYDLPSEALEAALHDVALQSGRSVLAPSALLAGKQSPPLRGQFSAQSAVRALLAGTGLEVAEIGDALVVKAREEGDATSASAPAPAPEIVVSASHIRGAPAAAPVQIIDQDDIERSGYAEIGDVIRSLPQSYAGGQNPGVLSGASATNPNNLNQSNASTVNLRGLGSDATLVLLDGHRLPGDGEAEAPDISVIPLAAVQRVEVITDGASALYGSDAVAGVVNFVMRSDYDGAEFTQRIGGASDGGDFTQDYTALAGKTWTGGHALISVDYGHQSSILASQRDFTAGAPPFNDLLMAQTQTSLFANFGQELTPWARFHLDGVYAQRQTGGLDQLDPGGTIYDTTIQVRTYHVTPSIDLTLPVGWSGSLSGSVSHGQDDLTTQFTGFSELVGISNGDHEVEANLSGPVFTLPAGAVKLALGGGYRAESFYIGQLTGPTVGQGEGGSRDIGYAYGEAFVPLVSAANSRPGVRALDLSLAGRWERYSDFGSTAHPKVGVRYKPIDDVTLRATWGTSFKAPQFIQMEQTRLIYYYPAAALGSPSSAAVLIPFGGNPNLKPERSSSWTAGVDWTPAQVPGLKISATYFNIDFTNRIVQPITSLGSALTNPAFSPFITYNPSAEEQAAAIADASLFYNVVGKPYAASNVIALVEDRYQNAASQKIDGVDLSLRQRLSPTAKDRLDAVLDASWLRILQQSVAGGVEQTLTGTLFEPPKLRIRTGLTWTREAVSATGMLNYVSGETDTGVTPTANIASFTTLDLNLNYKLGRLSRWAPNADIGVAISNVLDAKPPYAQGAGVMAPGYEFDSTNASAIGRVIAVTLRERF